MPTRIISIKSVEHYKRGGPHGRDCDGWHLVKTPDLSIIDELMPPGPSEIPAFAHSCPSVFYVLEGDLALEVEYHHFVHHSQEGIEISPGQRHQAMKGSRNAIRMIVTSQPPSHGDRMVE
jgi:mannose-6-phosphate isomerase-like protein (cupin superfamily)